MTYNGVLFQQIICWELGARKYKDYSIECIEAALKKVIDDDRRLRRAAAYYKIPYGTLNNKYHDGRRINKNGGQKVFSDNEIVIPTCCLHLWKLGISSNSYRFQIQIF